MRRLYSSFARGAPGAGLLLLRLIASAALFPNVAASLGSGAAAASMSLGFASLAAALLLVLGLWTPVAAVSAAILGVWNALSGQPEPGFHVLSGLVGVALALLGPGGWSVDARLFGWERFEIRSEEGNSSGTDTDRPRAASR